MFAEKNDVLRKPGYPNLLPASKGTVNILYGGDPNQQKLIVVENPATMVMDDWSLSDSRHAISGFRFPVPLRQAVAKTGDKGTREQGIRKDSLGSGLWYPGHPPNPVE